VSLVNLICPIWRRRRHCAERGFSLIELLIVIAIILIIIAIAVPKMNQVRQNAQEMAAVTEIQTVVKAELQYYSQFGQFATSLAQLGPPTNGGQGPQAADLIPGSLASGSTGGYNFVLTQTPAGYSVTAVPKAFGSTGRRTFYSDQSGVIRQNWSQESATAQSPEFKS